MSDVDRVIDTIDSALDDYATSDDAMRWVPDERKNEVAPQMVLGLRVSLHTADPAEGSVGTEITGGGRGYARQAAVVRRDLPMTVTFPSLPPIDVPRFTAAAGRVFVHVGAVFEPLQRSMIEIGRAVNALSSLVRSARRYHSYRELPRRVRVPMRVKYADRNVGPLAINGREYARRYRARRRRRR